MAILALVISTVTLITLVICFSAQSSLNRKQIDVNEAIIHMLRKIT